MQNYNTLVGGGYNTNQEDKEADFSTVMEVKGLISSLFNQMYNTKSGKYK